MIGNYLNVEGQEKENSKDDGGLSNFEKLSYFTTIGERTYRIQSRIGEKDDKFSLVNFKFAMPWFLNMMDVSSRQFKICR